MTIITGSVELTAKTHIPNIRNMTASKLDGFILPAHEIAQQIASNLSVTDVLNALLASNHSCCKTAGIKNVFEPK
ncbi:MAG TPA: hypothetical protein VIF37_16530 [Methylobacter sp.]